MTSKITIINALNTPTRLLIEPYGDFADLGVDDLVEVEIVGTEFGPEIEIALREGIISLYSSGRDKADWDYSLKVRKRNVPPREV